MPIHTGRDSKGPFVQWGHQKKYHYKAGDKKSLAAAKARAKKQMSAIFASGYHESVSYTSKFNLVLEEIYFNLINESSDTLKFFIANSKDEAIKFLYNSYIEDKEPKEDLLSNDLSNMTYCEHEFEWMSIKNSDVKYFLIFNNNHLIGICKYWEKSANSKIPTIGYISINNQFKHQGYGTFLIKKVLKYHKEKFNDIPVLLTEFSEEGEPYMKHVIEKYAKELNVDIFLFDDVHRLWENKKYRIT